MSAHSYGQDALHKYPEHACERGVDADAGRNADEPTTQPITHADPPFGAVWLVFSVIAEFSQNKAFCADGSEPGECSQAKGTFTYTTRRCGYSGERPGVRSRASNSRVASYVADDANPAVSN